MRENNKNSRPSRHTILFLLIVWLILCGFERAMAQGETTNSLQHPEEMIIMDGFGCRYKMCITPEKPNLGDNVKITFYLETPYKNIPEFRVEFKLLKGVELVSGEEVQTHPPLEKGESAEFPIKVKIISRHLLLFTTAYLHITDRQSGNEWGYPVGAGDIDMIVLAKDETISYEKFGNDPDLWPRIGPEYQYDIVGGMRIPPLGRVSEEVKKIREEIEELKKLDPTLSDWDALELLHDVVYEMVVRYGIHKKEESVPILIKARKLMREKGLSKWEAIDKIVDEEKKKVG